jgi:hypothetical protein
LADKEITVANQINRDQIVQHMSRFCGMTPEMCADKSNDMLLGIAAMMVGHRRSQSKLGADEIIQLGEMEKLVAEIKRMN